MCLLKFGLILHITGITMMVELTVANFMAYQSIWRLLPNEQEKASLVLKATERFPLLQIVGGALILAGGITMLVAFNGAIMHMAWFKLKMILLLIIIANGINIGRMMKRIRKMDKLNDAASVAEMRRRIMRFNILQRLTFLFIFVVSIVQFN